ncbi:Zinc finger and SCAN domain-containing protein 2-like, partial [Homarus americanus]
MMNNVIIENGSRGEVLSLEPLSQPAPHVMLGDEETMVTLPDGDPLLLCPDGSVQQAASHQLTYATLDTTAVNIVLEPLKTEGLESEPSQCDLTAGKTEDMFDGDVRGGAECPRLVVVGEAGTGDAMTYIYIQGEAETARDGGETETGEGHTITLNSADGSTLHTLPASYTQHLEHAYGDLVLVGGGDGGTVDAAVGEVTGTGDGGQEDKRVLLLSVRPLRLEAEGERPALALSSAAQESTEQQGAAEEGVAEGRVRRETGRREDETSTIEARLATRDSLLPPRRNRRCGDPGKLTCPVCHTQFKSGRHYHGHLQVHRGQGVWHCDMCQYTCDSAVELRVHKAELHHDARPFKCPNCHLTFPKSLMLEDHIRSVHNKERPFTCSFCTKGFYRPHDLKMHLNLHLGIKTNVCYVCGQQFSHPSNLIRHHRLHTGIKPYVCSTCGKRFTQVTLLHKHRATHQPGAGTCPLCPSSFRSAAGLRKHAKSEHDKSMTLQEAGRILRGRRGTGGRSYYCRVCGAQFSVKSELKVHEQREHGKGTQHRCASCDKVYCVADLKTHACLTTKEVKQRAAPTVSVTPEATITASANSERESDAEEEEEEYLVVYITSEGESVSYVMKKGNRASRDEVLQVDAPRPEQLAEETSARPEETIMINVQDRPPALAPHRAAVSSPDGNVPVADPTEPEDADPDSPLPVHGIKLEPRPSTDTPSDAVDASRLADRSFLSLVTSMELSAPQNSGSRVKKKAALRPISMKRDGGDLGPRSEDSESGAKTEGQAVAPLTCKDCGKKFQKQWNLQQHVATHDASLHRYKCGMCSTTFAYRSTLNKHMVKHRPTQEVHACQQCNKKYKCLASLKQHHKRDHMRHRPYVCEMCRKDFFSKSDFKYHMRCVGCLCCVWGVFCPKKFIQFVTLKIHLKKHEKMASEEMMADDSYPGGLKYTGIDLVGDGGSIVAGMNPDAAGLTPGRDADETLTAAGEADVSLGGAAAVDSPPMMTNSESADTGLTSDHLPPGTIILAQSGLDASHGGGQFGGSHTAVVTGVDDQDTHAPTPPPHKTPTMTQRH